MKISTILASLVCLTMSFLGAQSGHCQEHAYLVVGKQSSILAPGARSENLQRLELEIEAVIERTGEAPENLLRSKERLEKVNVEGSFLMVQYGAYLIFNGERLVRAKIATGEIIEGFNVRNPDACCGSLLLFDGDSIYEYTHPNDDIRLMLNQPVLEEQEGGLLYLNRSLDQHGPTLFSLIPHFLSVNRAGIHDFEQADNVRVERDNEGRVVETRQTITIGSVDANNEYQYSEQEIVYQFDYENSLGEWPFVVGSMPSILQTHTGYRTHLLEIESVEAIAIPDEEIFAIPYERVVGGAVQSHSTMTQ